MCEGKTLTIYCRETEGGWDVGGKSKAHFAVG